MLGLKLNWNKCSLSNNCHFEFSQQLNIETLPRSKPICLPEISFSCHNTETEMSISPCCRQWLHRKLSFAWWNHHMETFFALLALCVGNSPVTGEFPTQRPVTRNFVFFHDLRLNKWLSKESWGWWFETLSRPVWRYGNGHDISVSGNHIAVSWSAGTSPNALLNCNVIIHVE